MLPLRTSLAFRTSARLSAIKDAHAPACLSDISPPDCCSHEEVKAVKCPRHARMKNNEINIFFLAAQHSPSFFWERDEHTTSPNLSRQLLFPHLSFSIIFTHNHNANVFAAEIPREGQELHSALT